MMGGIKKDATPTLVLWQFVREAKMMLSANFFNPLLWIQQAYALLDLMWNALEGFHKEAFPKHACQRSGRCCARQTPRVSQFELERIAVFVRDKLPQELRVQLLNKFQETIGKPYIRPHEGLGPSCPFLGRRGADPPGVHSCLIHEIRPMICRMVSVSKKNSPDCKIWETGSFPVLPPSLVRPFLDLFSWCRTQYGERLIHQKNQMWLIHVGVMAILNVPVMVKPHHPEVLEAFPALENSVDENLYLEVESEKEVTHEEKKSFTV